MESAIYPRSSNNPNDNLVCKLLPQSSKNRAETEQQDFLITSDVVDGVRAQGVGQTLDRNYRWRLVIESRVRSIAQVPDRFFDILGRSYPIDWNSKVSVFNGEAPAYSNFKDAIIYKIGAINEKNDLKPYIIFDAFSADSSNTDIEISSLTEYLTKYTENISPTQTPTETDSHLVDKDANNCYKVPPSESLDKMPIKDCNYLAIVVNDNDDYLAFVGDGDLTQVNWHLPEEGVNVNQFRGLDMWNKFESINEMIYFILTKYEQNIISIETSYREHPEQDTVYTVEYEAIGATSVSEVNSYKKPTYTSVYTYSITYVDNENVSQTVSGLSQKPIVTATTELDVTTYSIDFNEEHTRVDGLRNEPGPVQSTLAKYTITYIPIDSSTSLTIDADSSYEPRITSKAYVAKVDEDYTEMKAYNKADKERENDGKLWCYINPRTMTPYLDDYWFHYKEPYYIKSLTMVDEDKQLDAKSITVRADVWPGVYMLVGETYIRNRDTGKDEHLQLVIPQAKVKSEQTLTLQADGEPTVFNLNLEVAQPKSKVLMEINTYKTELKMHREENGCFTAIDGSSEVVVM